MATNLTHEINGVRMTAAQADTACAFERGGYRLAGWCDTAITLRTRSERAEVLVAPDGRVIPWHPR